MNTDALRAALVADLAAVTAERDDLVTEVARLRRERDNERRHAIRAEAAANVRARPERWVTP